VDGDLPPAYDDATAQQASSSSSAGPSTSTSNNAVTESKRKHAVKDEGPLGERSSHPDLPPPEFSEHSPHVYSQGRRTQFTDTGPLVFGASEGIPPTIHVKAAESNILTHDPHLNEDGEALYRFILKSALTPPKATIRIRGSHEESREVTSDHARHHDDGQRHHSSTRTEKHTVIDFDFEIDCTPLLQPSISLDVASLPDPRSDPIRHHITDNPTVYVKGDEHLAYRGRMRQEILVPASSPRLLSRSRRVSRRRRSTIGAAHDAVPFLDQDNDYDQEAAQTERLVLFRPRWSERRALWKAAQKQWLPWTQGVAHLEPRGDNPQTCFIRRDEYDQGAQTERVRVGNGYETQSGITTTTAVDVKVRSAEGPSQTTVRMVCDDYALSSKELKSLKIRKRVAGWDFKALEQDIKSIVSEVFSPSEIDGRQVEVAFTVENDTITVLPDSDLARFMTTFHRSHGARKVLLIALFVLTGAFVVILPVAWILRHFKGARYNSIGIVWQLSQWEHSGATDLMHELLEDERQAATRAGAAWAADSDTAFPVAEFDNAEAISPNPNTTFSTRSCISSRGVVQQQPFIVIEARDEHLRETLIVHRGIRQGDVVKNWEARIRSAVAKRLRLGSDKRLGQELKDHLPPQTTRTYDPLSGQVRVYDA